jgi:hypothetical protein
MYPSIQQQQNLSGVAPPSEPTKGFESLKDLVRVLVINCNDKVRQFYISKLVEPADAKNDLIAFLEDFADLVLNTSEVLRYKKGKEKVKYNDIEHTIDDWCDLADDWIQMKNYEDQLNIHDVFRDGVMIYKAYLKALTKAEIFEV